MATGGKAVDNALGRGRLTLTKRIELLEKDREDQSRVLTALVEGSQTFTPEQLAQLRGVLVEVLADAGLRLEQTGDEDEARKDFMFLRAFRTGVTGTAGKIGWLVIAALCGALFWLVTAGLNAWRG